MEKEDHWILLLLPFGRFSQVGQIIQVLGSSYQSFVLDERFQTEVVDWNILPLVDLQDCRSF